VRCLQNSEAGEESLVIASFLLKHIDMRSFTALLDDKERPNGVILSEAKNLIFSSF
jgi:hypothetical protein